MRETREGRIGSFGGVIKWLKAGPKASHRLQADVLNP